MSSGHHNKNDRTSDGRRRGTRWDDPGPQTRPLNFYDQGGFPPPQGKHTRFDQRDDQKAPATGSKRERSGERNSHESSRSERDRDDGDARRQRDSTAPPPNSAKRRKRGHPPGIRAIPGEYKVEVPDSNEEFDELDGYSDPAPTDHIPSSRPPPAPLARSDSEVKSEQRTSVLFDFGRAVKNIFKPQDREQAPATVPNADQVQEALEAAAQAQSELHFALEELKRAQDDCETAREAERKAQDEIQRLVAEKQGAQTERAELMTKCSQQSAYIEKTNDHIEHLNARIHESMEEKEKYQKRVEELIVERGNVNSQLKQHLRNLADGRAKTGPKKDDISLDPFDNKVDQISEATVKNGVESLNDSLDAFTMALLDEVEELAKRHADSGRHSAVQEFETSTKLLTALAEYCHIEEKRGFLLDANLHHGLVVELNKLFFSGEVVCRTIDQRGIFSIILREMTRREPWTVVQRWRALTAATAGNYLHAASKMRKDSIARSSESIVALLSWAYRQPLETFQHLLPKIQSQLDPLYEEAHKLAIIARRDVLSVRMSIVVAPTVPKTDDQYLPYDPDAVSSVWPDMPAAAGDAVIALYKFGLSKQDEKMVISRLIKSEVTTSALLREMAKP
ncbi:hypothetical protein C8R47DRAFT_507309 [Mycena vitilis]|nr:hypothetical protein C8R47DRAFT_507309 [Mycena vitilis]